MITTLLTDVCGTKSAVQPWAVGDVLLGIATIASVRALQEMGLGDGVHTPPEDVDRFHAARDRLLFRWVILWRLFFSTTPQQKAASPSMLTINVDRADVRLALITQRLSEIDVAKAAAVMQGETTRAAMLEGGSIDDDCNDVTAHVRAMMAKAQEPGNVDTAGLLLLVLLRKANHLHKNGSADQQDAAKAALHKLVHLLAGGGGPTAPTPALASPPPAPPPPPPPPPAAAPEHAAAAGTAAMVPAGAGSPVVEGHLKRTRGSEGSHGDEEADQQATPTMRQRAAAAAAAAAEAEAEAKAAEEAAERARQARADCEQAKAKKEAAAAALSAARSAAEQADQEHRMAAEMVQKAQEAATQKSAQARIGRRRRPGGRR